jgi:hypothetical protein
LEGLGVGGNIRVKRIETERCVRCGLDSSDSG